MTSEDIIESLGAFGHWQRVILFSLCLPDVFVAFSLLIPVFTGSVPKWSCAKDVGMTTTTTSPDGFTMTSNGLYTDGFTVSDNRLFTGDINDSYVSTSPEMLGNRSCDCPVRIYNDDFTSIVSEWDLVCNKSYITALIISIQMSGLLVGAGLFGQLSDLYGRKKPFFLSVAMMSLSAFASSFSVNWQMYAVFRFFTGVSAGGYFCINCVYPLEFVGKRWRTLCGTLGFWAVGEMILAMMAFFIRDWHHLMLSTSVFGVLYFIFWWVIPDSPRWLARSGHVDEAKAVYLKIAKKNGVAPPDFSELDHMAAKREEEGKGKKYTYLDLFKTRIMIKITLITALVWFTTFMTYYVTSFNLKNLSGNRYLNMFFAGFVDLGAMISVILFNNILGRRISQVMYVGIAALCNIIILAFYVAGKAEIYAFGIKVSALIGKASALAGTYVVQIWSAELYPTHIRNLGVGLGSVVCRAGSFLSPQIVYMGEFFELSPYIFIVVLCCLVLPLCFLLSETNGKALQDDLVPGEMNQEIEVTNKQNENTKF